MLAGEEQPAVDRCGERRAPRLRADETMKWEKVVKTVGLSIE